MNKILITGASGFLGSRLALFLKDKYELLLPSHSMLNVSREEAVIAYLEEHMPSVVVHCAALSNTWYCQQHPEESHRVNVQGTVKLAKACKRIGAKYIFMSSDQVYNATPMLRPLAEWDAQQPEGVYGQHKLEAEQRALMNNPQAIGLRLTWLYDLPSSPLKLNSNILVNLHRAFHEGATIKAATHEFRGVTNVWELVANIEKTFALPAGIYNFGSAGHLNSHDLHLKAAQLMGLDNPQAWIVPDEERFAHQSRNLTMDCSLIEAHGIHFASSVDGIEQAIKRKHLQPYG
ncbi:MAG: sugar nucleotide-binding protein, partial [Bacteroidales bacterium]|nr:sugar nucleotide-binding protein [Bacteroidales bacterium]